MTEREVEVIIPILAELEALDEAVLSSIQLIYVELPEVSPTAGKG